MYKCYNTKRFLRLLMLDAIIFGMLFAFFGIGRQLLFSSAESEKERIFLPVIMYHSIKENGHTQYQITPEMVENDFKYLKEHNYNSVTAQQLVDYVYNDGNLPKNPVLITLDDGFYNNLYYLRPMLEKYDMYAVVSVVGTFVENDAEADPHIPDYSYLTWSDISEMLSTGRFEIGNHTYNMHTTNNGRKGCKINFGENQDEYTDKVNKDISLLQLLLNEKDNISPIVFAYPFGYICNEIQPVLKENGFLITLNCYERPNYITRDPQCLYDLNRYNRSGLYTTEEFMAKLLKE
ncbi:MAG: polysaccharide deacetylase family protein [Ruminococcus sp.]|nr:polysaccharide deacetylase family protein [Ruminococcus sp.]